MKGSTLEELVKDLDYNLYRTNAFRILGVAVDTSPRMIKRVIEKLRLEEKLGQGRVSDGYLMALVPDPTHDHGQLLSGKTRVELAQEAIERVNDPQKRLVEEFFWFWPKDPKNGTKDQAIHLTNTSDFTAAGEIWLERIEEGDSTGIALHNLAVLNHMAALDLEHEQEQGALSADQKASLEHHWQRAYAYWGQLLIHDAFWKRLQLRVEELDDPRLTKTTGEEIKQLLPTAIPLIAAKLVGTRVEKGEEEQAAKHVRRMALSGFPELAINKAKAIACEPLRERVNILADSIGKEAEEDPVHAESVVSRTLQSVRLALDFLTTEILFGEAHPTTIHVHDHIVNALTACLAAYGNKTEDWENVIRNLVQVQSIARSDATKQSVSEALIQAKENAKSPFHWVTPGYFELPASVLNELEQARALFNLLNMDNAIGKLENAYRKWPAYQAHFALPLSMCLFLRAMQRFTEVSRAVQNAGQFIPSYQREQIRTNVTQIGRDLVRALEMDPKNPTIRERYCSIQEIGRSIGASIPRESSSKYAPSLPSQTKSKPKLQTATTPRSTSKPNPPQRSGESTFIWIAIITVGVILLLGSGLKSCGSVPSTPLPRRTSTPRIQNTPTRRPPTRVPTSTPPAPAGIPASCIRWDRVADSHIGKSICIYGIVQDVKPGNGVFTIEFSAQWGATKIQDFNYQWYGITPGVCIEAYGKVRDNVSYLFISPDLNNPRIYYYDTPAACR